MIISEVYKTYKTLWFYFARKRKIAEIRSKKSQIKLHYGCGTNRQHGYLNVDIRWTPAVDMIGSLSWCAENLPGQCSEIYMSHVLEHYGYPGQSMKGNDNSVVGALKAAGELLSPTGCLRLAVPDFKAIVELYISGQEPLFPKLIGRICGEQDYTQNLHRCVFDKDFLKFCLKNGGYTDIEEWDPVSLGISNDSSFDTIAGKSTSLNLIAYKKSRVSDIHF